MVKGSIMAKETFININFPFKDSPKGLLLDLTRTDADAIKADLMHLILTRRGERLYKPDFGTNLLKFIFNPNDGVTQSDIKEEISTTVSKYLPKLKINDVSIVPDDSNEHLVTVKVDYTITDDVFEANDFVIITI
jgi:phage baseplate assembly protein W